MSLQRRRRTYTLSCVLLTRAGADPEIGFGGHYTMSVSPCRRRRERDAESVEGVGNRMGYPPPQPTNGIWGAS